MNVILFDDEARRSLLPLTHTRPVADIRCGILTARERWERLLHTTTSTLTEEYLQGEWPVTMGDDNLLINGALPGDKAVQEAIEALPAGYRLVAGHRTLAAKPGNGASIHEYLTLPAHSYSGEVKLLTNVWDIFSWNDAMLRADFALLTADRKSAPVPGDITVSGAENIFIEDGARIGAGTVINATTGPVYLGRNTEIMEGCMLRGPLALCEGAVIKMGAKIYGATTLGPECRAGGELSNVVMTGYSNKGHDGFLGNAVIGEWCNLGADTNCSNLKNDYGKVKIWSEHLNRSVHTGLTFCGLIMADHSKCAINTAFNTATVVGVACNIFGSGFPDRFVPSFTWGGAGSTTTYAAAKAADAAQRMMERRGKTLSPAGKSALEHVFEATALQRAGKIAE